MASIFGTKPPKQPDYKADLQNTENSILKRLNTFIEESTNKWKSNNDWIKKTGEQVNELLKRTFDLQRTVEGDMIEMEGKFKREISKVPAQLDKFYDDVDSKFPRREELINITDDIAGTIKKIKGEKDQLEAKVDQVRNQIPKNTVKNKAFEDVVSELRGTIEKVANAIPTNVASNELLADTRREIIALFDPYVTSDALKSVERATTSKINKVANTASEVSKESKKTQKEFNKVAAKVTDIENDYVSQKMLPAIEEKIKEVQTTAQADTAKVKGEIPTDYATITEVNVLREFQRDILNKFEEHKKEQNKSTAVTMANIESIMTRTSKTVEAQIGDFKTTLAETTMGEDTNFMKTIVRDIADEEIKSMRNQAMLLQENTKQSIIEMKNQNRSLAQKLTEVEGSLNKLIKLATKN